ncbi:MAG TPA: type II toxin-antitoxin system RelE/ParE family toxin [Epsilonproteobacteria bacterium]|nr:type II toxin-antitoxin system RelE/ParE family toxin [Campylobacterota bacterium]
MIKITFSQNAVDALLSQAKYIYELTLSVEKADNYLDEMEAYIHHALNFHPQLGRPAPELGFGVRKLVYKRYTILYRITDIEIEILTIYKQNLPSL